MPDTYPSDAIHALTEREREREREREKGEKNT